MPRLETGETVLVLGASGGVGRAAVQLAHEMGARVLAGVVRPERAASVRATGADAVCPGYPERTDLHELRLAAVSRIGVGWEEDLRWSCAPAVPYGNDGHRLFFGTGGSQIWGPLVESYLARQPAQ